MNRLQLPVKGSQYVNSRTELIPGQVPEIEDSPVKSLLTCTYPSVALIWPVLTDCCGNCMTLGWSRTTVSECTNSPVTINHNYF